MLQRKAGTLRRFFAAILLCFLSFGSGPASAEEDSIPRPETLRSQAESSQRAGDWVRASDLYEQLLARDRNASDLRERYLYCLRRAQQFRRIRDHSYRLQIADLSLPVALEVYGDLLNRLRSSYVDRGRTELGVLFQNGLEEFRLAFEDDVFRRQHVEAVSANVTEGFLKQLIPNWGYRTIRDQEEAQVAARDLALVAQKTLGIRPGLVVLELACGACACLDESTAVLTPEEFASICASLKGEVHGVGMEVLVIGQRPTIAQVLAGSPADLAGIRTGDCVHRIGARDVAKLQTEQIAELLKGELGSLVEVVITAPGDLMRRTVKLTRQPVRVPSVSDPRFLGDRMAGIGYLQISSFHEATARELDEALVKLQMVGLRALILDLRANPGGVVDGAVQVTERFLPEGVVTSTRGQLRIYNRTYEASNPGALSLPLVVLIDGETASAAELVAGALKDHQRATLVGQTSHGKGTLQRHGRLAPLTLGMRVTVARLFSPSGKAYAGTGITPHVAVEAAPIGLSLDVEQDPQVRAAVETARQLLMGR